MVATTQVTLKADALQTEANALGGAKGACGEVSFRWRRLLADQVGGAS
jgi:hypothetical protein